MPTFEGGGEAIARFGDMHPTRSIKLLKQRSGDVVMSITQDGVVVAENGRFRSLAMVEFCVSGGRSPHTLQALYALMEAIERDNAERPIKLNR